MATEIERKFLLKNDDWKRAAFSCVPFKQGYLHNEKNMSVRVRIEGLIAKLTIKGGVTGITRDEYEYKIPVKDAEEMFDKMLDTFIEKNRYYVQYKNHTWEIDEFLGENKGLVVAELELKKEDEIYITPDWIGEEVSFDERYLNACLLKNPYKNWK